MNMPTTTIRKWVWGDQISLKEVCGTIIHKELDETALLTIPKGSFIQSATVWTEGHSTANGRVTLDLNGMQIFDKLNVWDAFEWNETIDVIGNIKPPPPAWGNGSNAFHLDLRFGIAWNNCFKFRLYVEVVVFAPEPDEGEPPPENGEQPHWEEDEGNGKYLKLCTIAFLFGATSLSKLFPILRMFRDHVLPKIIVEGYYRLGYILLHGLV